MTDKELRKLLSKSNNGFYNTQRFKGTDFNKWIIENGYKKRRPVFAKKYCFRGRSSLASIVNYFFDRLTEETSNYPIPISITGLGVIYIYESDYLSGKPRNIVLEDNTVIKVVDDYFTRYTRFELVYKRPRFKTNSPYLAYHISNRNYRTIIRRISKKYPKGKFYPLIKY